MTITPEALIGYVERDLDTDLARWFADQPPVEIGAAQVRPIEPFLARLAPRAAAALAAFDARVRSGTMPLFLDIFDWSYGFGFADNDCELLDSDYETALSDDDVYTLAADGSGSLYTMLTSGHVALWFHEEGVLEGNTRFDDLDTFLWSMVRYRAVRSGRLDPEQVAADFRVLGQDGALAPEIGLLATLRART